MANLASIIEKEQAEQDVRTALVYLASLKGGVSIDTVKVRPVHVSQALTTQARESG